MDTPRQTPFSPRRHTRRRASLAPCLALAGALAASASSGADDSGTLTDLISAAITEVQRGEEDGAALKALIDRLPRDFDGSFIVEGDLALSRHELVDHLAGLAPGLEMAGDNSELLLATVGGQASFYASPASRRLTYAVDRASFDTRESYEEMVALMEQTTTEWEDVCPACQIDFVHETASDTAPSTTIVNFVVQFREANGFFAARAFYPHDTGKDRILYIGPTFYSTDRPRLGMMRHEVGHILGYRHEQIQGVPGCGAVGSDWIALTEYDNRSIMHYFCGDAGNETMVLSETDRQGHRLIYQTAAGQGGRSQ